MSHEQATADDVPTTRHIRPTVRRRRATTSAGAPPSDPPKASCGGGGGGSPNLYSPLEGTSTPASASAATTALGPAVVGGGVVPSPQTRGEAACRPKVGEAASPVIGDTKEQQQATGQQRAKPKGILREPKYSAGSSSSRASRAPAAAGAAPAMVISSMHDDPSAGFAPALLPSLSAGPVFPGAADQSLVSSCIMPSTAVGAPSGQQPIVNDNDKDGDQEDEEIRRPLVRDVVVERNPKTIAAAVAAATAKMHSDPQGLAQSSSATAAIAVEGYAPSIDGGLCPPSLQNKKDGAQLKSKDENVGEPSASLNPSEPTRPLQNSPTVVRSVSELVALARGTSDEASEGIDVTDIRAAAKDGEAVETEVSFACMTKSEYEETLELEQKMRLNQHDGPTRVSGTRNRGDGETDDETDEEDGCGFQEGDPNNAEEGDLFDEEEANYEDGGGPSMDEVFFGKRDIFGPDGEEDDDDVVDDEEGEGEGCFLDFFSNDGDDEDSIGESEPKPRPFLVLWSAISAWITPDAADILAEWAGPPGGAQPEVSTAVVVSSSLRHPYDRTDVGASRCAGLMSMLKMNLPRSLDELGYDRTDGHVRRLAEGRLAAFVRSFDYKEPMVKFDTKMWRAMTIILVDICLPGSVLYPDVVATSKNKDGNCSNTEDSDVPPSIKSLEVSIEEYYYLTREAIPSLTLGGS